MRRRITWLDVFTSRPLAGNGLAVVHEADGLDDATMLALARETKLSETTFVQTARAEGADYRNRIWTTTRELPFAGHPSLGTAVAVARERGESKARYVQQTGAGLQPIEVTFEGERATAWMAQERADFGEEVDPAVVMAALGLPRDAADTRFSAQFVSTGAPQLIACARGVERVAPDYEAIDRLLRPKDAVVVLVAEVEGDRAHARAFFPTSEQGEDPATGSGAGPLLALVAAHTGTQSLTIEQGVEMGRPSVLFARMEDGVPHVGGEVVVLMEGEIRLDI